MEALTSVLNYLLPIIIIIAFVYFFLVLITCVIGEIRYKLYDKSSVWSMNKAGKIIIIALGVGYVGFLIWSIYDFVMRLVEGYEFFSAIGAFNLVTVYTVIYALLLQDNIICSRKALMMGNRLYEYRRIKKVGFPKKHRMQFIYDQKQLTTNTWLVDITTLKRFLVKAK